MKKILPIILFGISIFIFGSCKGHSHDHDGADHTHEESVDKSGPEYTSAYICPMHCKGSGADGEGKCPVCKMDYVVNKDLNKDGDDHDHDHDHDGHSHDGDGHNHDHDHDHDH